MTENPFKILTVVNGYIVEDTRAEVSLYTGANGTHPNQREVQPWPVVELAHQHLEKVGYPTREEDEPDEETPMKVGEQFKDLRVRLGMTQKEVGKLLNLKVGTIASLQKEKRVTPTYSQRKHLKKLVALAKEKGIEIPDRPAKAHQTPQKGRKAERHTEIPPKPQSAQIQPKVHQETPIHNLPPPTIMPQAPVKPSPGQSAPQARMPAATYQQSGRKRELPKGPVKFNDELSEEQQQLARTLARQTKVVP